MHILWLNNIQTSKYTDVSFKYNFINIFLYPVTDIWVIVADTKLLSEWGRAIFTSHCYQQNFL